MGNEEKDIFSVIGRLPAYSKLLVKLYRSSEVRKRYKILLSMGIAYSLSPIELIPGIIPVAGQLDNLLIMLRCLQRVLGGMEPAAAQKFLEAEGMTLEGIQEDITLTGDTLKAIGRGTVKVAANTAKAAGYLALHGLRILRRKKTF